jgi:hypothetical protein
VGAALIPWRAVSVQIEVPNCGARDSYPYNRQAGDATTLNHQSRE